MSRIKWKIGIDGDIEKSGFCIIKQVPFGKKEIVTLTTLPFFDVVNSIHTLVKQAYDEGNEVLVCIESGWENKTANYHAAPSMAVAANIGMKVGMNHAIGMKITEYCEVNKIPYKLVNPDSKKWDARMFKMVTGWSNRSNAEERDAVRAAW
jgi:hypothetical protein